VLVPSYKETCQHEKCAGSQTSVIPLKLVPCLLEITEDTWSKTNIQWGAP